MSQLVLGVLVAVVSAAAAVVSAVLVYRVSARNVELTADEQRFQQQATESDRLRADIVELDDQRRAYYAENVVLRRTIERYRNWGYALARLLTDRGVTDLPPEPEETA